MIKAILFDMDGVLIDARDWHYEAFNRALAHFGYHIDRDAHLSTFDGLPTREKLQILSKSRGLPNGLHEFINSLKQMYTVEIIYSHCKPKFNHRFALSKIKAMGLLTAVCSNSVRSSVETMISLAELTPFFDILISNEDVRRGKPDPEMYLLAMNRLGVTPEECLILEDNDHGVAAALASGAHLLRISDPDQVTISFILDKINDIQND